MGERERWRDEGDRGVGEGNAGVGDGDGDEKWALRERASSVWLRRPNGTKDGQQRGRRENRGRRTGQVKEFGNHGMRDCITKGKARQARQGKASGCQTTTAMAWTMGSRARDGPQERDGQAGCFSRREPSANEQAATGGADSKTLESGRCKHKSRATKAR